MQVVCKAGPVPQPDRRRLILDSAIGVIARTGVRGLRVEAVAAEAGVAVSLIYYYFGSRKGLVRATLDHANERAASAAPAGVRATLLAELDEAARETSTVWGEIQASAVFEPDLREQVREATDAWVALVTTAIEAEAPQVRDTRMAAERLTALVDGLSNRWLAGVGVRGLGRDRLGHQRHPRVGRLADLLAQVFLEHRAGLDLAPDRAGLAGGFVELGQQGRPHAGRRGPGRPLVGVIERRPHEALARAEVVVDQRHGDARLRRHDFDAEAAHALARDHRDRGIEDQVAAVWGHLGPAHLIVRAFLTEFSI